MAGENIPLLTAARDRASKQFIAHSDPGNLLTAQKTAWHYTDMALLLLFKAAQMELDAAVDMQALLAQEPT